MEFSKSLRGIAILAGACLPPALGSLPSPAQQEEPACVQKLDSELAAGHHEIDLRYLHRALAEIEEQSSIHALRVSHLVDEANIKVQVARIDAQTLASDLTISGYLNEQAEQFQLEAQKAIQEINKRQEEVQTAHKQLTQKYHELESEFERENGALSANKKEYDDLERGIAKLKKKILPKQEAKITALEKECQEYEDKLKPNRRRHRDPIEQMGEDIKTAGKDLSNWAKETGGKAAKEEKKLRDKASDGISSARKKLGI